VLITKTRTIGAVIAVGAIGVGLVVYEKIKPVKEYTVEGTITYVNAMQRQAGLEYNRPRTGRPLDKTLTIPAGVEIVVNHRPASLAEVRVGDHAVVEGRWTRATKELELLSIRVAREPANIAAPGATQDASP
jgi:hypothetical protein